jgi:hypothetical protein
MPLLFGFLRSLFISRETLVFENIALSQQLAAYKRICKRPRLRMLDRAFWVWLSGLLAEVVHRPHHRQTPDRDPLALSGLQALLAMDVAPEASGQADDPAQAHRIHQADEPRQSILG